MGSGLRAVKPRACRALVADAGGVRIRAGGHFRSAAGSIAVGILVQRIGNVDRELLGRFSHQQLPAR
jgi:hypothetical protein